MSELKMSFNRVKDSVEFKHHRSESTVKVVRTKEGAVVQFIDRDSYVASVSINDQESLDRFAEMVTRVPNKHFREVIGTHFDGIVLSMEMNNWGEPYEEAIQFDFELADPQKPYMGDEIRAYIDEDDVRRLLFEIGVCIR